MTSVERSLRGKFRKIILEENFTFRRGAGCSVVLLKQFGPDIVRRVNMDTRLYTAPTPYHHTRDYHAPKPGRTTPKPTPKFGNVREVHKITKVLEDGRENGQKSVFR